MDRRTNKITAHLTHGVSDTCGSFQFRKLLQSADFARHRQVRYSPGLREADSRAMPQQALPSAPMTV